MNNIKNNLFQRFFKKRSSADEAKAVFEWIADESNGKEVNELFKTRWNKLDDEQDAFFIKRDIKDEIYYNVLSNIEQHGQAKINNQGSYLYNVQSTGKTVRLIAAVIVLLIISGIVSFFYLSEQSVTAPVANQVRQVEKSTQRGERLTTKLPDGTTVILNANSSISYPERFSENERKVELDGEGYFKIKDDIHRPFIVKSGLVETKALGTAFNVREDKLSGEVIVSLTDGKVVVKSYTDNDISPDTQNAHILDVGEEIKFGNEGELVSIEKFECKEAIGWKDGVLLFNGANVDELAEKLENWYDVNLQLINKPDHKWSFTSTYKNESLENVLKGLQFSKNIRYEINGKEVVIIFNNKTNRI